jgi:hypothetical protein
MLIYQYDIKWTEIPRHIQGARQSLTIEAVDIFLRETYDVPSSSSYRITGGRDESLSFFGPLVT